jgi:hypothetical protein
MKKGNEAETRLRLQGVAAAVAELADDLMEPELAWQVLDGMGVTFDDLQLADAGHYDLERIKPFFRNQDIERQESEIEAQEREEAEDGPGP